MSREEIAQWDGAAVRFAEGQENSEFDLINRRAVFSRYQEVSGLRVLDLGCGPGAYTEGFRVAGAEVVGFDGSAEMLRLAREKYPLCTFIQGDLTQPLPFADGSFDLILCNQVLMDIDPIAPAVCEAARILKPGGRFCVGIVHPAFYDCEWGRDESGFRKYKIMEKYLSEYHFDQNFWGQTRHYHRPVSFYLNAILASGLTFTHMDEPVSYDGIRKSQEFPLFLIMEFRK